MDVQDAAATVSFIGRVLGKHQAEPTQSCIPVGGVLEQKQAVPLLVAAGEPHDVRENAAVDRGVGVGTIARRLGNDKIQQGRQVTFGEVADGEHDGQSLDRSAARVPIGGLLVGVPGAQDGALREGAATKLEADGQTVVGESAWDGYRGHSGQGVASGVGSTEEEPLAHVVGRLEGRGEGVVARRGIGRGGADQHVNPAERVLELTAQQDAGFHGPVLHLGRHQGSGLEASAGTPDPTTPASGA